MATPGFAVMKQPEVDNLTNGDGIANIPEERVFNTVENAEKHLKFILSNPEGSGFDTKKKRAVIVAEDYNHVYMGGQISDFDGSVNIKNKKRLSVSQLIVTSVMQKLENLFGPKNLIKADNENQGPNFGNDNLTNG